MLSALNDKRGAPRVSGAVNGKKPLTEEDKKTVDMKTTILILSRLLLVSLVKSTLPEGESS